MEDQVPRASRDPRRGRHKHHYGDVSPGHRGTRNGGAPTQLRGMQRILPGRWEGAKLRPEWLAGLVQPIYGRKLGIRRLAGAKKRWMCERLHAVSLGDEVSQWVWGELKSQGEEEARTGALVNHTKSFGIYSTDCAISTWMLISYLLSQPTYTLFIREMGFSSGSVVNSPPAMQETQETSERSLEGGHSSPLQCSCLENPMNRGSWQAIVHRVAKSQAWASTSIHETLHEKIYKTHVAPKIRPQ